MTLPSLYRLERRGLADAARWSGWPFDDWTDRPAAATTPARRSPATGEHARRGGLRPARRPACPTSRATSPTRRPTSGWPRPSAARARRSSTWRSRPRCSAPWSQGLAGAGLDRGRPRRRGEALRPRPRVGARRSPPSLHAARRRVPDLPHRPLPREDGLRGDPLPAASPTRCSSRSGTGNYVDVRADHHGRDRRRRGPGPLLRPGRRAARRGRQPPDAGRRVDRHGAARRPTTPDALEDRGSSRSSAPSRRPTLRTTCAASTRATATIDGRRRRLDHRDLRRAAPRDRRTGAGRASPSSSAPASGCRRR